MRTNRRNWDYERRTPPPAQYNDKCPVCGLPCFSGAGPDNTMIYTCMNCIEGDALAASFDNMDIPAIMERIEAETEADEYRDFKDTLECARGVGLQ
jgi:hypothetical protein